MAQKLFAIIICFNLFISLDTVSAMVPKAIVESHVHSLEQFVERINGREIFPLVDSGETDPVKATRYSVFDMDFIQNSSDCDSTLALMSEFVDALAESGVEISMSDTDSWITVDCVFSDDSNRIPLQLCMRMEEFKPGYWCWTISDVIDTQNSLLKDINLQLPINPLDHEFDFLNLDHFFSTFKDEIYRTKSAKKDLDKLSFFFGLVSSGKLKLTECGHVVFHSRQIPGWEFKVEEIDRIETSNSGWLITSLAKNLNQNK